MFRCYERVDQLHTLFVDGCCVMMRVCGVLVDDVYCDVLSRVACAGLARYDCYAWC